MNPFRSAHIEESPESAEYAVFSAMHALVERLAVAAPAAAPVVGARRHASGDVGKHTAMPSAWRNGIVPNAGVKIP